MSASPGDPCPCGHYLVVVKSEPKASSRVRYLGCRNCGYRPPNNKLVVPLKISIPNTLAVLRVNHVSFT